MDAYAFKYELIETGNGTGACYYANSSSSNRNDIALSTSLPFFLLQLTFVLFMNHLVTAIVKLFRQPRVFGQVLTGVLLGPSIVGETGVFTKYIFPYKTVLALETFANLAVVLHVFLVGLEIDKNLILRSGRKALSIALAGVFVPLGLGLGLFFITVGGSKEFDSKGSIFWAIALTATNFPELTQILADLKLLRVDIGRTALSSSLISDLCTWLLLLVAILILNTGKFYYTLLSTVGFILLSVFAIRLALSRIFNHALKGENLSDQHIWFILAGILFFGLITDGCGAYSILGAFIFGVVMPHGQLITSTLRERLNDFVMGTWMPLFFLITGFRTNLTLMFSETSWKLVLLVLFSSSLAKIVSTFLVSLFYRVLPKDGLALGVLMNTKGILALIVLNTGRNIKALNNQTFAIMILAFLVMTCLIEPILAATYMPTKQFIQYKCRTIQKAKQKAEIEFRILACVYSTGNISGMINLLQVSNATNQTPLRVFAVHLVELVEHTTAMLIMHDRYNSCRLRAEAEHFMDAFENYGKTSEAVIVQTLTSVSTYESMHEDICGLAEDKRVALIIIPFHEQLTADGKLGNNNANNALAGVNHNVLANTPCSVGIFVDRGLCSSKYREPQHKEHLFMLFIGGPDDREALAYAWRMAGHPYVKLTVVRFLQGKDVAKFQFHDHEEDNVDEILTLTSDFEREKQMDDEDIFEFKFKTMDNESVSYVEKVVNNGEESVAAIRALGDICDLYIVGRGKGMVSPLTSGLSDCTDFPELGIMGYMLTTFNFASHASILVMQQYANKDQFGTSDHTGMKQDSEPFVSQIIENDDHDDNEDA